MIKFMCADGDVTRATFVGDLDTLTAEILLEISILYGTIKMRNADAAEEFKSRLDYVMQTEEGRSIVFSGGVAKHLFDDNTDDVPDATSEPDDSVSDKISDALVDKLAEKLAREILDRGSKKDEGK